MIMTVVPSSKPEPASLRMAADSESLAIRRPREQQRGGQVDPCHCDSTRAREELYSGRAELSRAASSAGLGLQAARAAAARPAGRE